MGRKARVAARCCLALNLLLSVTAAVVTLVCLAGLQSACSRQAMMYDDMVMYEPAPDAPDEPWPGQEDTGGAAGWGGAYYDEASKEEGLWEYPAWEGLDLENITQQELPEFVSNLATAVRNNTRSRLEVFFARLGNSTNARLQALLATRFSQGALNCARTYSLHWWAWVSQLLVILLSCVAMCSGKCGRAMATPVFIFTGTVVVLDMVVCNQLFNSVSYYFYPEDSMQAWSSGALAGFILACISNYCLIFAAPLLMLGKSQAKEKVDAEERTALASAADS